MYLDKGKDRILLTTFSVVPFVLGRRVEQLEDRGLIIDNDEFVLSKPRTISYYRLSAYWHSFRKIAQGGAIAVDFEEESNNASILAAKSTKY